MEVLVQVGVRQKLKAQGIQLVMAIVPAKVRLYPEHLGEVKPASIHANLYQDFHARVAADKIIAPDLLGPLQQAKLGGTQVFLRTDTHWTPDGAEIAAKQLAKVISEKAPLSGEPQRFVTEAEKTEPHKGDLRLFLRLETNFWTHRVYFWRWSRPCRFEGLNLASNIFRWVILEDRNPATLERRPAKQDTLHRFSPYYSQTGVIDRRNKVKHTKLGISVI